MDEPAKLPPHQVDALAQRLQSALKRRRPHGWVVVVALLIAAVGALVLLAWWMHGQPVPPRLEVVVYDQVAAPGETPRAVAQLAFPDDGDYLPALLRGHDVVFLGVRGDPQTAISDANGRAEVAWSVPATGTAEPITVRYVDARHKQGSADQAHLFAWERGAKILLVAVEETLAAVEPGQWAAMAAADIPLKPHAALALQEAERKKYRVGYVALGPASALAYRKVRGWTHAPRPNPDRLPAGPVLVQPAYPRTQDADAALAVLLHDLKKRFGDQITLIAGTPGAANVGRAAGVRVVDAVDWAGLARQLDQ